MAVAGAGARAKIMAKVGAGAENIISAPQRWTSIYMLFHFLLDPEL